MRRVIALVLLLIGGLAGCSDPGAGESQRTVSQSQVQSAVVEEMHTPAMQRTIRDLVLSSEARAMGARQNCEAGLTRPVFRVNLTA
ncbi:MAG: hypothetical protein M0Z27_11645 [Thermaerobacter sp.]|nr:hypothetical protein [Thermaerobacter sp.]